MVRVPSGVGEILLQRNVLHLHRGNKKSAHHFEGEIHHTEKNARLNADGGSELVEIYSE